MNTTPAIRSSMKFGTQCILLHGLLLSHKTCSETLYTSLEEIACVGGRIGGYIRRDESPYTLHIKGLEMNFLCQPKQFALGDA